MRPDDPAPGEKGADESDESDRSGRSGGERPRSPEDWLEADLRHYDRLQRRRHGTGSGSSRSAKSSTSSSTTKSSRSGRRGRRWYRRPRNIVVAVVVLVLLLVAGYLFALNQLLVGITRAPLLADFDGPASTGQNILLVGSTVPAGSLEVDRRTSVVQLVHLSADRTRAEVIYFPRDLYLPSPGTGTNSRIEDVYARSGTPGLTEMIQDDVGVTVDHVLQVGFTGYAEMTDLLGGVQVDTAEGIRHFSGDRAHRWNDAHTDSLTTGRRNQEWLKGMLNGLLDPGVLLNPVKVYRIGHAMAGHTVADRSFSTGKMRSLLWSSRNLRPDRIRYLTVPHGDYATRRGQRVLLPDVTALQQLGAAVNADSATGIAAFDN